MKDTEAPISKLLIEMSEDYRDIESMPYMIRSHGTKKNIDDEFIDLLHDRIELVYRKYGHPSESGMILLIILTSFANGKIYTNDPLMEKTSYPFRSNFIALPIFMFYNNSIHSEAERMSEKWLDDTMEILMLTKPFNYGKDDYRYYHNKTAFKRLQQVKLKYDPTDLFHTNFTIPLPINDGDRNKQDL